MPLLRRLFASICLFLVASAIAAPALAVSAADAQRKVSEDLHHALTAPAITGIEWARDTGAGRLVKVLILADNTIDPGLEKLRRAVVDAGGSRGPAVTT